ncbi:MAG TPA: hypothetical protein VFA11_05525 [Acidimicrobiales bacterium]|nr:hypothetical protein [Acidimicrobiales bacterium]
MAAGSQVVGGVLEGGDLAVLGRQVGDRVAHQVNEVEVAAHPGGREIAEAHLDVCPLGVLPCSVRHGLGQLDPVHPEPAPGERDGQPARSDPELEGRPASGEAGEEIHRGFDDLRSVQVGPQPFVVVRDPFAEGHLQALIVAPLEWARLGCLSAAHR